jgi:hypothetical protein
MFIPSQTPDLQQPLTQRLETKPVQPVTAVAGVPEDAQNIDSRIALQWAQPVLQAEKGQSARTALVVPLAVQIVKPLNIKGFEPQGPDPDALLKGEVHPMLAEGLASWINFVLNKPVPSFRTPHFRELSPQAQALPNQNKEIKGSLSEPTELQTSKAAPSASTEVSVSLEPPDAIQVGAKFEPAELDAIAPQLKEAAQKNKSEVMQNLLNLYKDLSSSDIFAAQRLSEAWLPRPTKTYAEAEPNSQTEQHENNAVPVKHASPLSRVTDTPEEFKSLAQPISEPSMAQLTKWVAALEPDSEQSQQAAHMLTQGQMVWQSELTPGIPMRIVREDAWRNAANKPAQLEKGAMLKVEVELPNLGRIRITGSQWGQDLSLQVAHASNAQDQWSSLGPDLLQDLLASGISDVRLETLADDPEVPNG